MTDSVRPDAAGRGDGKGQSRGDDAKKVHVDDSTPDGSTPDTPTDDDSSASIAGVVESAASEILAPEEPPSRDNDRATVQHVESEPASPVQQGQVTWVSLKDVDKLREPRRAEKNAGSAEIQTRSEPEQHGGELMGYGVGSKTKTGVTVDFIYGQSKDIIVFRDTDGHVQWEVDADYLSPVQARVNYAYDRLRLKASQSLGKKAKASFRERLAQALFHGLGQQDEQRALSLFQVVEAELQNEAQRYAQILYFGFSSVAAAAIIAIACVVAWLSSNADADIISLAAAAGAGGAWASVLQRVWKIDLSPNQTPGQLSLQGGTRIILGGLFGAIALAAIKASLLLPAANSDPWALGLAVFVAGFSERMVPDLIGRIEGGEFSAADGSTQEDGTSSSKNGGAGE